MSDKLTTLYAGFLGRVDAILDTRGYALESQDVAHGDWRFDWYQSFVAGCLPYEAVEDALAELRDRGLLDVNARHVDGPFASLRDMRYDSCPCGCGSKEVCERQRTRVQAQNDAIPF